MDSELLILIKLTFPVNYKAFQFQSGAFFVIEKIVFADNAQSRLKRSMAQAKD